MIDAKFIGQQGITVGTVVAVRESTGLLRAGSVDSVSADGSPVITTDGGNNVYGGEHGALALAFVPTQTVDDVEAIPPGSWTYRPTV